MTPEEATDTIFKAARSGDIATAQAAIDAGANLNAVNEAGDTPIHVADMNGHTDMVHLLNKAWWSRKRARNDKDNVVGGIVMITGTLLWVAMLLHLGTRSATSQSANKPIPRSSTPTPEVMEAGRNQVRSALKDPAVADRLIEQVKDPLLMEAFMADPEIMNNLQKLADAIERNVKNSPSKIIGPSYDNGDSTDMNKPRNWSDKAVQQKSVQSPKRH